MAQLEDHRNLYHKSPRVRVSGQVPGSAVPVLGIEVDFDQFRGVVIGFFPLPSADRVLCRLHQDGISALYLYGPNASIGLYLDFEFDCSAQLQASRHLRVHWHNSIDNFAVRGARRFILPEARRGLGAQQHTEHQQNGERETLHSN